MAVVVLVGVAGCGSATPSPGARPSAVARLTDVQVERWLAAVQALGDAPTTSSTCFLVPASALSTTVAHPPGRWVVEGYDDQTGDARRFAGCGIRAVAGGASGQRSGDGEIGIEATAASGHDADRATRQLPLPGTSWTLSVTSWPGQRPTTTAELDRVERAVVSTLATPPASGAGFASPATPFG